MYSPVEDSASHTRCRYHGRTQTLRSAHWSVSDVCWCHDATSCVSLSLAARQHTTVNTTTRKCRSWYSMPSCRCHVPGALSWCQGYLAGLRLSSSGALRACVPSLARSLSTHRSSRRTPPELPPVRDARLYRVRIGWATLMMSTSPDVSSSTRSTDAYACSSTARLVSVHSISNTR